MVYSTPSRRARTPTRRKKTSVHHGHSTSFSGSYGGYTASVTHSNHGSMEHEDGSGGNADAIHSGGEAKHMYIHLGHKPHHKAIGSYLRYTQDHCLVVNNTLAGTGQTCLVDLFSVGSFSQLATTTGTGYGAYTSDSSYLSMNPNEYTTGSTIFPALVSAASFANDRIFLKKGTFHFDMTSTVSTVQYVKLRCYIAKRDLALTPLGVWGNLAGSNAMGKNKLVQPASGAVATVGYESLNLGAVTQGGGSYNATFGQAIPGISAAGCIGFSNSYKVLHERSFILAPGASERIICDLSANWLMKQNVETLIAQPYPKGTLFFQLEVTGAVETVHSFTTQAPAAHSVPGIALVAREFLSFQAVEAGEQRFGVAYGAAFENSGSVLNQVNAVDQAAATTAAA